MTNEIPFLNFWEEKVKQARGDAVPPKESLKESDPVIKNLALKIGPRVKFSEQFLGEFLEDGSYEIEYAKRFINELSDETKLKVESRASRVIGQLENPEILADQISKAFSAGNFEAKEWNHTPWPATLLYYSHIKNENLWNAYWTGYKTGTGDRQGFNMTPINIRFPGGGIPAGDLPKIYGMNSWD